MGALRIAVIVPVHNESVFLRPLIRHYEPEADAVFVLDNESDDGSTEGLSKDHPKVVVSSHPTGGEFSTQWKTDALHGKKAECAGKYDYVLIVDADEFVVPKQGTIRDTIERTERQDLYSTDGWNIFQYPWDAPYDPARPILSQRKCGLPNAWYSKPIIVRPEFDAQYSYGCHYILNHQDPKLKDPALAHFWLFHLKFFDDRHYLERLKRIQKRSANDAYRLFRGISEDQFVAQLEYERSAGKAVGIVPEHL